MREQSRGREFKRLRGYLLADSSEETLPQYVLWYQKNEDTYYSSSWEVVQTALKQGREYWGQSGYILKSQKNNTIPLYPMWYSKHKDWYFAFSWDEVCEQIKQGRESYGYIEGYIYDAY